MRPVCIPCHSGSGSHNTCRTDRREPARVVAGERLLRWQFWLPVAVLVALSLLLMLDGGDLAVADQVYAWEGHRWALKSAFVAEHLLHVGGRDLSVLAWVAVLAAWTMARLRGDLTRWRRPLGYLLLAVLLSTVLVAWVKSWSNMDCPWDLARYGGQRPYIGPFGLRPIGLSRGACFPAGHASAGYAWLALYFAVPATRPKLRRAALATGMAAGLAFGIAQQLRGAHFLSHDVWTATICWMTALGLNRLPWTSPDATRPALPSPAVTGGFG